MITPELLRFVFQYHQWANRRTVDSCAQLTNEQFTQDLGSSFGSIRDTLMHLYGAGWAWNERFEGRAPSAFPAAAAYPDLASVRAKLEEIDSFYLDLVTKATPEELARMLHYKSITGEEFSNPLWQILHHYTNHGSYHRGQVVTMLRQLGAKPVSTNMIELYREQAARATA